MPGIQNSKSTLDFLGTIGSTDRGDGVSLNNTAKALVELADLIITEARENMDKNGNTASGMTASSMAVRDLEINGTKMSLDIEIASTYKFLNDGVKGTQGGTGKYSFKTMFPSKKMALAILKWLRRRNVVSKYKAYTKHSKNEPKNKKIHAMVSKADSLKSLAYAISTNIKKKGIKPTKFFTKALEKGKREQKRIIAGAFKLDIIESLNEN